MSEELKSGENSHTQGPSTLYDELKAIAQENRQEGEIISSTESAEVTSAELAKLGIENVPESELIEILEKASTDLSNDEVQAALRNIRIRRQAGNSTYRINDSYTYTLDSAVIKLAQDGRLDLAKELISSSPQDLLHLERVLESADTDPTAKSELKMELEKICQQKQEELRQDLQAKGVSESMTEWIINSTSDPDSSADISSEFWQSVAQDSYLTGLLESGGSDLAKTASALGDIKKAGLEEHNKTLLKKVISLEDQEKTTKYLDSLSAAINTLDQRKTTEAEFNPDMRSVVQALADFEDPMEALKAANTLYGSKDPGQDLRSLYRLLNPGYGNDLAKFREDDIISLGLIKEYCNNNGIRDDFIQGISAQLISVENPIDRAKSIAEGLRLANVSADSNLVLFTNIARAEDPISLGRAASIIEASIEGLDIANRQDLQIRIVNSQNPEATATALVRSIEEIQKRGLTIEDIGVKGLFEVIDKDPDSIERYCSDWKIQHECEEAYKTYLEPVGVASNLNAVRPAMKPKLEDFPELSMRLEQIGLPIALQKAMLESWLSYSSLKRRLYGNGELRTNVTPEDIDHTLAEQGRRLVDQVEALSKYVEQYGPAELKELVDLFGIHNFVRYKPELLHEQLSSWKSGEPPAKNIVVSARADWNGAVDDVGDSYDKLFGAPGLFFFEASDRTELAKAAVAVGNRERAFGRIPEDTNSVENFIVDGHASPTGILLGTKGQKLATSDYLREPLNGQGANTYQRHLGRKFRVILKACSTAGEVAYGKNIAESIADQHDVRVEASKELTSGSIVLNPDGSVSFNGGVVPSTVYE